MSSDELGAASFALGVLVTAYGMASLGEGRPPAKGMVWTAASSDKVASHPTLAERSLSSVAAGIRKAELTLIASASRSAR
jgi:hypothetical protein